MIDLGAIRRPLESRPSRARGLKRVFTIAEDRLPASRPSRARGLKLRAVFEIAGVLKSRPSRARGLKLSNIPVGVWGYMVAPFTGAWIETRVWARRRP